MLASLLVSSQGIEVQPVFFSTPFFSPEKALESAEHINLPLKIIDITERHFELLKNPRHGFGGNMNPCIDCHALMFRIAGEMLENENADFIISGEVLGQRPMSQNRGSLYVVEKESTMKGLVLRPLSAKLLPVTIPESEGWIDRERLMALSGRSRKSQMAMADSFNITKYPAPAGGCLLTDIIFSIRLKDLLDNDPILNKSRLELLKTGRHFRVSPRTKIIAGRNEKENDLITELSGPDDILLHTIDIPGPVVIISGETDRESETIASLITASYSDAGVNEIEIALKSKKDEKTFQVKGRKKEFFRKYMI